jgi:hypothetical protein
VRRPQKRPLQAILVKPIPEDLAESLLSKQRLILFYIPPLGYLEYIAGLGVSEALDELSAFLLLFINGVDLANQFQAWMTTSRPEIYKAWQPLW